MTINTPTYSPDQLQGLIGAILQDLRDALLPYLHEGVILSIYLVGSACNRPPRFVVINGQTLVLGDIDLLIFVNDYACEHSVSSIYDIIEHSRSTAWGPYKSIHIGCRIRPQHSLLRTIMEYYSWGENICEQARLIIGQPLLLYHNQPQRNRISQEILGENVLSKLWFIIYSLFNLVLNGEVCDQEVVYLQYLALKAAGRLTTLKMLATTGHQPNISFQTPEETIENGRCIWKSQFVRATMDRLSTKCKPPMYRMEWDDLLSLTEALEVASCEVFEALSMKTSIGSLQLEPVVPYLRPEVKECALFIEHMIHHLRMSTPASHGVEDLIRTQTAILTSLGCNLDFTTINGDPKNALVSLVAAFHNVQARIISRNLLPYRGNTNLSIATRIST